MSPSAAPGRDDPGAPEAPPPSRDADPDRAAALYRRLVESASDLVFSADPTGVLSYVNTAAARLTGYTEAELVGQCFCELVVEEHRDRLRGIYGRLLAGEIPEAYVEYPIRTRAGAEVWLGQSTQAVLEGDRRVGVQVIARDITAARVVEAALRESEERFRQLAENIEAVFWMHDVPLGRLVYVSPSFEKVWGMTRAEVQADPAGALRRAVHPEDRERILRDLEGRARGDFDQVYRIVRPDHSVAWIRDRSFRILAPNGSLLRIAGIAEDVTERQLAEEESSRLAALSRENPNPVLECGPSGRPIHVNPAAEATRREMGLREIAELLPRNHHQLARASLESGKGIRDVDVLVGGRTFSWAYRPDSDAGVVYLFGTEVTGRRLMEEQLRHDALHDALTGLPNRLLFMERLAHSIARARRRESFLFAVLFLDLDRFKVVNDSLGHQVGDELLVLVAKRLQRCLRAEDLVARFGGDEFAILLDEIGGISDATRVAERIQAELSASVNLDGFDVFTSASIGIALSSSAYDRPEYLLRNADMAMYRAKALGQARFEVFDRTMHAHALSRLQLETDLRRALERGEFLLHYQPIVSLADGSIRGAEALVRWRHPEQGLLNPDDFIPVAEETGVILPLGRWVLGEACRSACAWRAKFGEDAVATIGVNLSAKQFSQPDLVEQILDALRDSGLPASALRLEITESAVMENADAATMLLGRLKALGVQLALDDFGTGYSSLSYLHRFPLDALKIDRSFIGGIDAEERTPRLVETVLTLAGSLGVAAVAEGIETEEQLATLRALGCEAGQGFYFSRPLDAASFEAFLAGSSDS